MSKVTDILSQLEPEAVSALKIALGLVAPQAAAVGDMLIDGVDNLVRQHNPTIDNGAALTAATAAPGAAPADNAPKLSPGAIAASAAAPATDMNARVAALEARVAELETHVAALTVATGHDTSALMSSTKATIAFNAGTHGLGDGPADGTSQDSQGAAAAGDAKPTA